MNYRGKSDRKVTKRWGHMELFGDGLQLVGFLAVTVAILASLVAVAIGMTVFLYMADRRIEIDKRERCNPEANIPAEAQS
jgi:hypothetical protein